MKMLQRIEPCWHLLYPNTSMQTITPFASIWNTLHEILFLFCVAGNEMSEETKSEKLGLGTSGSSFPQSVASV